MNNKPVLAHIPTGQIDEAERVRKEYSKLDELKADIDANGLIHPIAVMEKVSGGGEYKLLAGGRRYRAMVLLLWDTIPCRVYPPMDELDQQIIEEAENLQREDLSVFERALQVQKIHNLQVARFGEKDGAHGMGHSQTDTAELLGVSRQKVGDDLRIARGIEIFPDLAKCKTRKEALKTLDRLTESLIIEEIAKRVADGTSEIGVDVKRKELINNFVIADFFTWAKQLPKGCANVIEVDPPYAIDLQNVKHQNEPGGNRTGDYNEVPADKYPEFLSKVAEEAWRLLPTDGWLLMWYAIYPWHNVVWDVLTNQGFVPYVPAIWSKGQGQTHHPEMYLASSFEPFFYARKGSAVIFKQGRPNVFSIAPVLPDKKYHPTQRPIALMEEILAAFCPPGGSVITPFAGSGATLLAASNMGLKVCGADLSKAYKDAFTVRVVEGTYGRYAD